MIVQTKLGVSPLKTLLFYTFLMVTLPIMSFFVSRNLIGSWGFDEQWGNIGATFTSVVFVHIVLAMFVYEAYHEPDDPPAPQKPAAKID